MKRAVHGIPYEPPKQRWEFRFGETHGTVLANTRSEARARLKPLFQVPPGGTLPKGVRLRKLSPEV